MINGKKTNLIEIVEFLFRFEQTETEQTVFWPSVGTAHLKVLGGVRDIPAARRNPMAHDAWTKDIRDELEPPALPRKQNGTRTAGAVELSNRLARIRGEANLILQHSSGPKQTQDINLRDPIEANGNIRVTLSEVSGGRWYFEFLANRSSKDINLSANRAFVVIESIEMNPEPVIAIASHVAQEHRGSAVLRNQQILCSITKKIRSDERARTHEMYLVQAGFL